MSDEEFCHVDVTSFHNQIGSEQYPFEAGRYWLFTSKLCPFSQRTEIARIRAGLESYIGLTIAGPTQTEKGWNLAEYHLADGSQPSPLAQIDRIPQVYELAQPGYSGAMSVPVLFDTKTHTIVNNESSEIVQMFDALAVTHLDGVSDYPLPLREDIDATCRFLAEDLISQVYKAGFAKSQTDYDGAADRVFAALATLNDRLSTGGRFLVGDHITLADIHAFPHLARFDAVFHSLYRLNHAFIRDYDHLGSYLARVSKETGFGRTLNIDATKQGYFKSWNQPSNAAFVPIGPEVDPATGVARNV